MAGTVDDPSIELPLSADWLPVTEAHRSLCSPLGSPDLAAKDLTDVMARAADYPVPVRSMRRCFARGVRQPAELLPASYWIEHRLDVRSDGVFVVEGFRSIATVKGYAFFVWKPDLAKNWPAVFAPPSSSQKPPQAGGPGRRTKATKKTMPKIFETIPNAADPTKILEDIAEDTGLKLKTVRNRYYEWQKERRRPTK
jgi:hypothetical protein